MARPDLLALTDDDLIALTNRGTVKRAQRELASGDYSFEVSETSKKMIVKWSDDIACTFPADGTIHDALCSSGGIGITRYVIRSVLAYQTIKQDQPKSKPGNTNKKKQSKAVDSPANEAWNPGDISDTQLERQFGKAALNRARKNFKEGVLVELTLGSKPVARFLHESCTIRFPVPNDLRYSNADCADRKLPLWSMMAVWSFRKLPAGKVAGLVSIQSAKQPIPTAEIEAFEKLLVELIRDGISGVTKTWKQRVSRVEKKLRSEGLIWPAELGNELAQLQERYAQHDARFDPVELVRVVGEIVARNRVIKNSESSVPQALVRGTRSDRATAINSARYMGVGLGVNVGRSLASLKAYFQDVDTGSVVAIERNFNDPAPDSLDEKLSFTRLSQTVVKRGVALRDLAVSQTLIESGKRTPSNILILPRGQGKLSANPHTFQWEQLKPPFAVEDFEQLRQRIESLPPAFLRPKRCTENLFVLSVDAITGTDFDVIGQQLIGVLKDKSKNIATLIHPYHSRGSEGFNEALAACQTEGENLIFVCGHVRLNGSEIQVFPVSLVFETNGERKLIQVWLHNSDQGQEAASQPIESQPVNSPIQEFQCQIGKVLGDILVVGVSRANLMELEELIVVAKSMGCVKIAREFELLFDELSSRKSRLKWDAKIASRIMAQLCVLFIASNFGN